MYATTNSLAPRFIYREKQLKNFFHEVRNIYVVKCQIEKAFFPFLFTLCEWDLSTKCLYELLLIWQFCIDKYFYEKDKK